MTLDFWHERWQRGEIGWHLDEINLHLQEHWPRLGVDPGGRVLVPLCGKTLDLAWLVGQGQPALGVELSPIAVEALFRDQGLVPEVTDEPPFRRYRSGALEVLCGDFFDLTQTHLGALDAVYDRASLIALPPETRRRYAAHLMGLLSAETRILLITLDYDQAQMTGPPFAVAAPEVRDLFGERFEIEPLGGMDVLGENPRFRERGLERLLEQVYVLSPRG
jgi:thiopurine S-methyltransferase